VASWEWDFTGGGSAYSPGPATVSHTFGSAGTYTVWVRAIGPAPTSFTATRSITVQVRPAPAPATPTASPGTSVLTNTTVSFTTVDTAGRSGLTWTWTVSGPDPWSTSGGPSMSRLFTVPGTYTVTATARDDLGITGSASVIVTVTDPAPSIDAGFGFTVSGLDVTFTDQSTGPPITSWTWEFGDGTTSTLQNPVHTYAAAGVYPVRLTVTGPGSQVDSAIRDVTVS
jgi:PKD repeat protein